jgi:Tfp pilus assembly protein PilE
MRTLVVAAIMALLMVPAYSQFKPSINLMQEKEQDPAVQQQRKDIENEYRSTVGKIPDQKKKNNDPWQNLRSSDPAKKNPN